MGVASTRLARRSPSSGLAVVRIGNRRCYNGDKMSYESERATRRSRIDPKLAAAGWKVVQATSDNPTGDRLAIEEFETDLGPADYALCDGGRCLGVVEAKKLTLGPQGVLVRPSATRRRSSGRQVPGRVRRAVPLFDQRRGALVPRRPPPAESLPPGRWLPHPGGADEMLTRDFDAELGRLAEIPMNERMRPYQIEANAAIEQAIRSASGRCWWRWRPAPARRS